MLPNLEQARQILSGLAHIVEDCWILRAGLRARLAEMGLAEQELTVIEDRARANATYRAEARERFSPMFQTLEELALDIAADEYQGKPPTPDKTH